MRQYSVFNKRDNELLAEIKDERPEGEYFIMIYLPVTEFWQVTKEVKRVPISSLEEGFRFVQSEYPEAELVYNGRKIKITKKCKHYFKVTNFEKSFGIKQILKGEYRQFLYNRNEWICIQFLCVRCGFSFEWNRDVIDGLAANYFKRRT